MISLAIIAAWAEPRNPVEIALSLLKGQAVIAFNSKVGKESYAVKDGVIHAGDGVGALYAAQEWAESANPKKLNVRRKPYLQERGMNLFLTLPWDVAKNNTDASVEALTDPKRWWFQNDGYWKSLLDLMVASRLNWLDMHGAWDISVTDAPNLYAYFVQTPSFPKVGVPPEVKAQNLARLNRVIAMAHARGIRVSLMSYQAGLKIPQNPDPGYPEDEKTAYEYTREAVETMIRQAPGLDAIGFRIGESGKSESFFTCYQEAVNRSGRQIPLITRSWITRRQNVVPLARASKDFTVEIKYNGEQWGSPYMLAGGRMANWYSYSFEDYLSDSSAVPGGSRPAKMWPGLTTDGGKWPDNPYKIVWQVRANGTHRLFPFYSYDRVRSSVKCMRIGTCSGMTVEGLDAYFPKDHLYYLANSGDRHSDWTHERDSLYWNLWGRLSYDPETPESVFRRRMEPAVREQAKDWTRMSDAVARIFETNALGPDHRNHAPELETGGLWRDRIQQEPFDTLMVRPIREEGLQAALGIHDGRISAQSFAAKVGMWKLSGGSGLTHELQFAGAQASSLAAFNRLETEAATQAALAEAASAPALPVSQLRAAADAWRQASESAAAKSYKPFTDRLRMHTNTFHWRDLLPQVQAQVETGVQASKRTPYDPTEDVRFSLAVSDKSYTVTVQNESVDQAWLLVKPMPSAAFFHRVPMKGNSITLPREQWGACVSVEIARGGRVSRRMGAPPYRLVPPRSGPTPQIYSSEEAMRFLDPSVLAPEKYGSILIAPRAMAFFRRFDAATQRKLLDPVRRGMNLVVLQQDYLSGRYPMAWLPAPLRVAAAEERSTFDADGQLGMGKIEASDVLWQRFLPSAGWDIRGNGGIAHMSIGKGNLWLINARLMQRMTSPACARALQTLIRGLGAPGKPCVLVDPGTEDASYSTAAFPDMMNLFDVPFLTLGEVIAREQGLNSFQPIAGAPAVDQLLSGQGTAMLNRVFRGQVVAASSVPSPASLKTFEPERQRRRAELLRCLGLSPMPPKTPLNARITGTLPGAGYRIEKLVFESRPGFFVTGHVYVPATGGRKFPVIMNVNGHWAHKKDEDRIQLRCAFQALRGFIAIAIDSPGWSFEGGSLIERRAEGTHNDWFLVQGGTNATGLYVYDTMRALDYMETRPDTDMSRVGITGASGGGLATLYAFAADDRYAAAVPVVYMSSMETAPDNGCLCNHVPGTCQVGDRSDVIGIQCPKPVLIMGAENDGEFPPAAMRRTYEKMQAEWKMNGSDDVLVRIFPGPHDYSQAMREAAMGFFEKHLFGKGDGSPIPQPALTAINSEDRSLLALDPVPASEKTMRDVLRECLRTSEVEASAKAALTANGGRPSPSPLKAVWKGTGRLRTVVFESEPGLQTPGVLVTPAAEATEAIIHVSDGGKPAEPPAADGKAHFYVDVVGTGELKEFEPRFLLYLGCSAGFKGGWQLVRARELLPYSRVSIEADGPISCQAALYAGLLDSGFASIIGKGGLQSWDDVFVGEWPPALVQPRANLCGPLAALRKLVPNSSWN